MKFAIYLHKELIFLKLDCETKESVLQYLTEKLCDYYRLTCKQEILHDIKQRENIKSTGLGQGLAIPHGRTELVNRLYVVYAYSEKGIEWFSEDKQPVHFIFLIVGPAFLEKEYLGALSDISRIMIRHDVKDAVRNAKTPEDIISVIKQSGIREGKRFSDFD